MECQSSRNAHDRKVFARESRPSPASRPQSDDARKPLRLVKQRGANDCVIACVACVTGQSYKSVRETNGTGIRGGLTPVEMEWLMDVCDAVWVKRRVQGYISARLWAMNHPNAVAILMIEPRVIGSDACHVVVAHWGSVFDPSDGGTGSHRAVVRAYVIKQPPA